MIHLHRILKWLIEVVHLNEIYAAYCMRAFCTMINF
jgi:hypothetical protein